MKLDAPLPEEVRRVVVAAWNLLDHLREHQPEKRLRGIQYEIERSVAELKGILTADDAARAEREGQSGD